MILPFSIKTLAQNLFVTDFIFRNIKLGKNRKEGLSRNFVKRANGSYFGGIAQSSAIIYRSAVQKSGLRSNGNPILMKSSEGEIIKRQSDMK